MVEWGIKSYLGPAETKSFVTASASARGAACNPPFIDLALATGIRMGADSKISFCYPRDLRASPQTYRERDGVIYCGWSICRWLSHW